MRPAGSEQCIAACDGGRVAASNTFVSRISRSVLAGGSRRSGGIERAGGHIVRGFDSRVCSGEDVVWPRELRPIRLARVDIGVRDSVASDIDGTASSLVVAIVAARVIAGVVNARRVVAA